MKIKRIAKRSEAVTLKYNGKLLNRQIYQSYHPLCKAGGAVTDIADITEFAHATGWGGICVYVLSHIASPHLRMP